MSRRNRSKPAMTKSWSKVSARSHLIAAMTLKLIASPDGRDGSVTIHADAALYSGLLDGAQTVRRELGTTRRCYVHLVRGSLDVNGQRLQAGDALLFESEALLTLANGDNAEVLVFDLH